MSTKIQKKNIILILGVLVLILISLAFKYNKYILEKDYFVYLYASCDTQVQNCFQYEDEEDYYTKMYQKAYIVERCMDGTCDMYACSQQEQDQNQCLIVECSEDTLEEGELCVNNQEI